MAMTRLTVAVVISNCIWVFTALLLFFYSVDAVQLFELLAHGVEYFRRSLELRRQRSAFWSHAGIDILDLQGRVLGVIIIKVAGRFEHPQLNCVAGREAFVTLLGNILVTPNCPDEARVPLGASVI